jgi:hypothetical protein
MRHFWVGCLLIATMARAQTKPASVTAPSNPPVYQQAQEDDTPLKPPSATAVAADVPVLTIKGLCAQTTPTPGVEGAKSGCQTVVTRAQFEKLTDALRAGEQAQTRRHLAKAYPQFLVMAHEAEQRGLDKLPRLKERLEFARLQILSQELMRQIQEEAAQVPEGDIEDYYQKNMAAFESVSVERIVIPIRTQVKSPLNQGATQGTATEDAMTKEAELLRIQAATGDDFSELRQQAYDAAGVGGNNATNPKLGKLRRRGLPPAHASVFDLKPGQVSPVITDATGHYIYKLDSKGIESLDAVRPEITTTLRAQRAEKLIQSLEQPFTTKVNEAYFGADASPETDGRN